LQTLAAPEHGISVFMRRTQIANLEDANLADDGRAF
jgi:hypothetical protein